MAESSYRTDTEYAALFYLDQLASRGLKSVCDVANKHGATRMRQYPLLVLSFSGHPHLPLPPTRDPAVGVHDEAVMIFLCAVMLIIEVLPLLFQPFGRASLSCLFLLVTHSLTCSQGLI